VDPPPPPSLVGTVLVSPNGNDSGSCGPAGDPCATITQGIARAAATAGTQVFVANGVYLENVVLFAGIDVLGGFSSDFSLRDVLGTGTVVHGAGLSSPTVSADTINTATIFEGFIVHGASANTPGENSIAMSIVDSTSALEVKNNVIVAGLAAAGADGSSPVGGGIGGVGAGGNGGAGGTSNPPLGGTQNGSGINGTTSASGPGGAGGFNGSFINIGFDCPLNIAAGSLNGSPGGNGGSLSNGTGGVGGLAINGSGASGTWISASGTAGGAGNGRLCRRRRWWSRRSIRWHILKLRRNVRSI